MKQLFCACILLVAANQVFAQTMTLEWATQLDANNSQVTGSELREDGSILVRGFYKDYIAIENDSVIFESDESQDSYLLELSANGSYNWIERFDKTTGEVYQEISSFNNHIYNHGRLQSLFFSADMLEFEEFDVGLNDTIHSIVGAVSVIDEEGNVYTAGSFRNTQDFDPESGQTLLSSMSSLDAFLAKYDSNRKLIWVKGLPSQSAQAANSIALDGDNNVIIASNMRDSVDIDQNLAGFELPNGPNQSNSDYLLKCSENGDVIWFKALQSTQRNKIQSIATDNNNDIIITGGFYKDFIFEINGLIDTLITTPYSDTLEQREDAFIAKLNADGEYQWVRQIGGPDHQFGSSVKTDDQGFVFVLGSFYDTLYIHPNIDSIEISNGFSDSFIQIYDKEGNYVSHFIYGGESFDWAREIHLEENNTLVLISGAGSEIDIDFGSDEYFISPLGARATFVAKYKYCLPGQIEVPYNGFDDDCNTATLDDDLDQDGFTFANDCDDNNPNINPDQIEVIYNGLDDDCDPSTLDDDLDEDGYNMIDDCDDNNSNINLDQTEVIYNGIDDDCDPSTLDDDLDQDGNNMVDDCDDNDPNINPDQPEVIYNGVDDDCNPSTLDDDLDQDGYNLANDCDDNDPNINPDQTEEVYNGIDDDCDPSTLDDDLDQDGYNFANDCDDNDPNINPEAEEIANNGIDEDCDGVDLISNTNKLIDIEIKIFPNPAFEIINIEILGGDFRDFQAALYDLNGKMVFSADQANQLKVDLMAAGIYLLEIKEKSTNQKIVESIEIIR